MAEGHLGGAVSLTDRRTMLLLLIGVDGEARGEDSVNGITRLQKFLFLLEQEEGVSASNEGFKFKAYKAGPYSSRLYDDLELLENLDLVRSEATAESTALEATDIDRLAFVDLIEGDDERAADAFQERRFSLTAKGRDRVKQLLSSGDYEDAVEGVRRVKSRYAHYSLKDLLRHVYKKYPDMTTESEIIDEVMGRRASR